MEDCPVCDGPGECLGNLGTLAHYRCQFCGAMFSGGADDTPEVFADAEHPLRIDALPESLGV